MKKRLVGFLFAVMLLGLLGVSVFAQDTYTYNITVAQPTVDVVITNTRTDMTFDYTIDRTNPKLLLDSFTFENKSSVPVLIEGKATVTGASLIRPISLNSTSVALQVFNNGTAETMATGNGVAFDFATLAVNETATRDWFLITHKDFNKPTLTIQLVISVKPV